MKTKRILGVLLTLIMLIGLMPMTINAADILSGYPIGDGFYVNQVYVQCRECGKVVSPLSGDSHSLWVSSATFDYKTTPGTFSATFVFGWADCEGGTAYSAEKTQTFTFDCTSNVSNTLWGSISGKKPTNCYIQINRSATAHVGSDATCQKTGNCYLCNAECTADHNYSSQYTQIVSGTTYKHRRMCTTSGCNGFTDDGTCSGGTATCKDKAVCSVCKNSYGTISSTHSGDEDGDHICDVCKKTLSECNDADSDHFCDVCEKTLSECADADHDYSCDICKKALHKCDYNDNNGFCINGDSYEPAVLKGNAYEISNAGQLFWFASEVNNGKSNINGKLTADIDLENKAWTPITNFSGTFDGAGYEIKNFAMNITAKGDYGLFGFVKDATIKDFTISGEVESTLTAKTDEFRYGVIADAAGDTIITDVHSYVNLTIKDSYYRKFIGGILGRSNEATKNLAIERCSFGGTLNLGAAQVDCTGGIVAYVFAGCTAKLNNCLFDGEIISQYADAMQIGGLMGYYRGSGLTITNALSVGDITVMEKNYMGSLVGILLEHSSANAMVKNNYYRDGNQPFGNSGNREDITDGYQNQTVADSATAVKEAQLESGETAYLLGEAWGQDLSDANSLPTLGGNKVYRGYEPCESTITYSNTELSEEPSEHLDETNDHICDICKNTLSECNDTDSDHLCDVCQNTLSECDDTDSDYICDICKKTLHECDYNDNNGFCTLCDGYEPAVLNGDDVYEISNAGQLYWFAQQVNSGNTNINGKLTANIVVNENLMSKITINEEDGSATINDGATIRSWTPIGSYDYTTWVDDLAYRGDFDGCGFEISGLYCVSELCNVGFFGYVAENTIRNLGVVDSYFINTETSRVGYDRGVLGCGSIAGYAYNTEVDRCYSNSVVVNNNGASGGIAGQVNSEKAIVSNCWFSGKAISNSDNFRAAGIVGMLGRTDFSSKMENCYNVGTGMDYSICGKSDDGRHPSNGTVTNCYGLDTSSTNAYKPGVTIKDAQAFASGEVAYLLNRCVTDGTQAFYQTVGEGTPTFEGKTVYYGYESCSSKEKTYSNTKPFEIRPNHKDDDDSNSICDICKIEIHQCDYNDNNGFCILCNSYEPAVLKGDVYEISNAGQLFWFAQQVNIEGDTDANAILTADIDLEEIDWIIICETGLYNSEYGTDLGYSGTFDGNNHIIKNIAVKSSMTMDASCGLFGTVSGTIKNLGIEGFTFDDNGNDLRAGAIVGQLITANGKVSNCYVKGATIDPGEHVTGGIAGCVYDGTIENCYVVESTISGSSGRFGHIVGDSRGDGGENDRPGTVTNCYCDNKNIRSDRVGNVTNCETKSTKAFASGEVAYLLNGSKSDSELVWYQTIGTDSIPKFAGGTVYKVYCVGTECYRNENEDYENHNFVDGICSHCGELTSAVNNNGIYEISNVGEYIWFAEFVNEGNPNADAKLMADIDLSEHGNVMIGTSSAKYSGSFDGNGKKLTVNFNTTEEYIAPFRYIDGATIQNLTVDGTIATSAKFASGLVGSSEGTCKIEKCMVGVTINSVVNGDGTHGGLVAVANSGSMDIDNCGFIGSIAGEATNSCGGFVGWSSATATIKNSYMCGNFTTGTSNCNTFGRNAGNITVSNSYYKETYGSDNSGATQMSAEQFASGEVAYLLNGSKSDGELAWGQSIGIDAYPVLGGEKVLFADGVYYNEINEFEILSNGTVGAKATATVAIPTAGTYTLIFADYEETGVNNMDFVTVTAKSGNTVITVPSEINITLGTDDKIMLWQDMTNLVPLCEAYIVK